MAKFVFEQDIFQHKFIQADGFKNRAKSTVTDCDSICPNNTDNANVYRGYTAVQLLTDTLHNVFGEVLSIKKSVDIESSLKLQMLECHESQVVWMRDHDGIDFPDMVKTCSRYRGYQCGAEYAEGFKQCQVYLKGTTKRLLP